jgi:hypothetical protein
MQLKARQWTELKGADWMKYRESVRRGISTGTIRYRKIKGAVSVTAIDEDVELLEEKSR